MALPPLDGHLSIYGDQESCQGQALPWGTQVPRCAEAQRGPVVGVGGLLWGLVRVRWASSAQERA